MSTHKVEITILDEILDHPNPKIERLVLGRCSGWIFIIPKGKFTPGDKVVYIPVDSILTPELEAKLLGNSKIKLERGRVKTLKMHGAISQGILEYPSELDLDDDLPVGTDVAEELGILKYEPPVNSIPRHMQGTAVRRNHPDFKPYHDINNFNYYIDLFQPGEPVYITEKLHGTSWRGAKLAPVANSWWRKLLKLVGLLPKTQICFGSRRVELQSKLIYSGYYKKNVYAQIAKELDLDNLLELGEELFGEIIGSGLQGGYTYGHSDGEISFYAYDLMRDGKFLPPAEFVAWCDKHNIKRVPVLALDEPFDITRLETLKRGDSDIGGQRVKEGLVIKAMSESVDPRLGRKILKVISEDYLLQKNISDFH